MHIGTAETLGWAAWRTLNQIQDMRVIRNFLGWLFELDGLARATGFSYTRTMIRISDFARPFGLSSPRQKPSWMYFIAILLVIGCGRRETEPVGTNVEPLKKEKSAAAAPAPGTEPPGSAAARPPVTATPQAEIVWTKPESWIEKPQRPVRKATYEAPGAAGPAEVSVFYFGSDQGGSVEANIARWVGQFEGVSPDQAKRDQQEVNGFKVYTVRVEKGTFSTGMAGSAKPYQNWGLNAAVVETPSGPYFFKMTGPEATVSAEVANFTELLKSIRGKG